MFGMQPARHSNLQGLPLLEQTGEATALTFEWGKQYTSCNALDFFASFFLYVTMWFICMHLGAGIQPSAGGLWKCQDIKKR